MDTVHLTSRWTGPKPRWTMKTEDVRHALVRARKRAKLTQSEVAQKMGRPRSWTNQVERTAKFLDIVTVYELCRLYGITLQALVTIIEGTPLRRHCKAFRSCS